MGEWVPEKKRMGLGDFSALKYVRFGLSQMLKSVWRLPTSASSRAAGKKSLA